MYWRTAIAAWLGLGSFTIVPDYAMHNTLFLIFIIPYLCVQAVGTIACGVLLDAIYKYPSTFTTMTYRTLMSILKVIGELTTEEDRIAGDC